MSVYRVVLTPPKDDYDRLVEDPDRFAVEALSEAKVAISATQFHLHLVWPSRQALRLIVEGEQFPGELTDLLTERLGPAWSPEWTHVEAAEELPAELEAGEQAAWIVRMALEPDEERCDVCHWPVPLHRRMPPPPCPCGEADDEEMLRALDPNRGGSSDTVVLPQSAVKV